MKKSENKCWNLCEIFVLLSTPKVYVICMTWAKISEKHKWDITIQMWFQKETKVGCVSVIFCYSLSMLIYSNVFIPTHSPRVTHVRTKSLRSFKLDWKICTICLLSSPGKETGKNIKFIIFLLRIRKVNKPKKSLCSIDKHPNSLLLKYYRWSMREYVRELRLWLCIVFCDRLECGRTEKLWISYLVEQPLKADCESNFGKDCKLKSCSAICFSRMVGKLIKKHF